MITAEKLQQFLDDLRLGKYDSTNYIVSCYGSTISIKDISKNVELNVSARKTISKQYDVAYKNYRKKSKIWRKFHKEPKWEDYEIYIVETVDNYAEISKSLYTSFMTFVKEQQEKDKLVQRANIESAFDL